MMPVQIEELSALLDGELSAERAAEVRTNLATDPALSEEYEALLKLDAQIRGAAKAALFVPEIAIPMKDAAGDWHSAAGTATVLALLAVRFLPKFINVAALGLCLQLAAGAAMIFVIMRLLQ